MKNSNGTLGGGDFYDYSDHLAAIKWSSFVNSRDLEIQTGVTDSTQRFVTQTPFRRSSICELL
jgi:hypothetical protein